MLRAITCRYLTSEFAGLASQKRISHTVNAVTSATNHILNGSSLNNLTSIPEKPFSEIAPESKSYKPWYYSGTIPHPDSPEYAEFEKCWIEECKIVADDIRNRTFTEEAKKLDKEKILP